MKPRDLTPCPKCWPKWKEANAKWTSDVLGRTADWEALISVAARLTGKSQKELVDLVIEEQKRGKKEKEIDLEF